MSRVCCTTRKINKTPEQIKINCEGFHISNNSDQPCVSHLSLLCSNSVRYTSERHAIHIAGGGSNNFPFPSFHMCVCVCVPHLVFMLPDSPNFPFFFHYKASIQNSEEGVEIRKKTHTSFSRYSSHFLCSRVFINFSHLHVTIYLPSDISSCLQKNRCYSYFHRNSTRF
jgi:hypothetical protein